MAMPQHVFHRHAGPWHLVDVKSSIPTAMGEIKKQLVQHSNVLALDMEWVPDRSKHQNNPVALLQLAIGDAVWLVRTCVPKSCLVATALPRELREILMDRSVTKLVVSFDSADAQKLQTSFGLANLEGILDISKLAQKLQLAGCGLKKIAQHYGLRIEKDRDISISNWAAATLSERQVQYARDDAFFTLHLATSLLRDVLKTTRSVKVNDTATDAPKVLEALERSWQVIDGAVGVEDTEARDLALECFVSELHAVLLAHGPVQFEKMRRLQDLQGVAFQQRARNLRFRLSKDFIKDYKGRFKVTKSDVVAARSPFELAPFSQKEEEICWMDDDALDRWKELMTAGSGFIQESELTGRLGLLGQHLRGMDRQVEAKRIDRALSLTKQLQPTVLPSPSKLPEATFSEQRHQQHDVPRTIFAQELPQRLEIPQLCEKIRTSLELPLERIKLFRSKNGYPNRGFGFLVFRSGADAQEALRKGMHIDGHLAVLQPHAQPQGC
ncbi:unnamed protein product [Durusdinium trenchii]|uniref:Exonuclease 3'-5' domain-containing protein 2 (3'-5' exoribonuclease EXD2) (Exonuclease 3'-5' domain-like-containing protein 2) n=2 Tax=Durusdinium trenchii TaxID=1381693 RepID=A0ABP0HPE3_9DINO